MYKYYGFLGVVFLIISHFLWLSETIILGPVFDSILIIFLHIAGLGFFFDGLSFKITGSSLIYSFKKPNRRTYLCLGMVVIAFISEFLGAYVLEIWTWVVLPAKEFFALSPAWQIAPILLASFVYYFFVFLALFGCYKIVYHFFPQVKSKILNIAFFVIILVLLGLVAAKSYLFLQSKAFFLLVIFLILWLFCEFIGHRQNKRGLLRDLKESNLKPLISIIVSAFAVGTAVESITLFFPAWVYQNLPWHNIQIFNTPVSFFLIWWVPVSVVFLSFCHAFVEKDEKDKLF